MIFERKYAMKIKEGFIVRKVGSQFVVAATGKASRDYAGIIRLNESSAYAFELLKEDLTKEELLSKMLAEYNVSREVLSKDLDAFLDRLREANALV